MIADAQMARGRLTWRSRQPMRRCLCIVLFTLLGTSAIAEPVVEAISHPAYEIPDCRVRADGDRVAPDALILYWSGQSAHMYLDGHPLLLAARELPCRSRCVTPGNSGYREFQFVAEDLDVILRKRVSCAPDAEACSGLSEGPARLAIRSSAGTSQLRVRNDYCDL